MSAPVIPATARLRATARIAAAPDGRGGTALPLLAGDGPLALRRTRGTGGPATAHVAVVGAMAAPLGGDRLRITVEVAAGAALRVTSAAATVSLPGRDGAAAHYDLDLRVGPGGLLEWLPEPVVAAARSSLRLTTRVELAAGARLLLREEQVLGRTGEEPGRITARTTVRYDGRTVLDQQTDLGTGAPRWDGPAVVAHHRACGQLLRVGPDDHGLPAPPADADAVLLRPAGAPATLLTAAAPDALALRRLLALPARPGTPPPAPR